MLTLEQAKHLKSGDKIQVITTKQEWTVKQVEMRGVLPFVHITMADKTSVITPERMYLFEMVQIQNTRTYVTLDTQEAKKIATHLQKTNEELLGELLDVKPVEVVNSDITISPERLETKFVEEPELTKPARKPTAKKPRASKKAK